MHEDLYEIDLLRVQENDMRRVVKLHRTYVSRDTRIHLNVLPAKIMQVWYNARVLTSNTP